MFLHHVLHAVRRQPEGAHRPGNDRHALAEQPLVGNGVALLGRCIPGQPCLDRFAAHDRPRAPSCLAGTLADPAAFAQVDHLTHSPPWAGKLPSVHDGVRFRRRGGAAPLGPAQQQEEQEAGTVVSIISLKSLT